MRPWTMRVFRPKSFNILEAARSQSCNPSARTNISMAKGICIPICRNYSHANDPLFERNSQSYRSAVIAGLVGFGGVSLFCQAFRENNMFRDKEFITAAYCKPNNNNNDKCECECEEEKCEGEKCEEKKCEDSDCLRKNEEIEECIQKANSDLEYALLETKGKAIEFTEAALKAYCDAIVMIKAFMYKVWCAAEEDNLDSPRFEEVWCDVQEIQARRCDLVKQALEKGECAWELLCRLRNIIEEGKCCKYTFCNPLLVTAEETLICAEREVCARRAMFDTLLKESRVLEQYRNIIEEIRRDLKGEADALVPNQECRVTLNDNEMNMVLTHAYRKILRCQAEFNQNEKKVTHDNAKKC